MDSSWPSINEQRFQADFLELSEIGKTGNTGVNRPALSPAHLASRKWLRRKIEQAGLEFHRDGAGNHFARLECGPPGALSLCLGSHLDSVPTGGRYDGALGVLAGLEVLHCVHEAGLQLPVHLELIDFTDEEGSLVSFLGSFAFAGLLKQADLMNPRGSRQMLEEGIRRAGLSEASILSARRDPKTLAGYLELHIEQGPVLHIGGYQIGIVTQIAGIAMYRLSFRGRADHAGTITVGERLDAGVGASSFSLGLRSLILERFPECYANIGSVQYEPGAYNIVPEKANVSLEFRAASPDRFQDLMSAVLDLAENVARNFGLGLEVEFLGKRDPVTTDPMMQTAIENAASKLGLSSLPILSRAGHDAQPVAGLCPTGIIFLPSVGGISHSPDEFTSWQDCVNGANVLLHTTLQISQAYK